MSRKIITFFELIRWPNLALLLLNLILVYKYLILKNHINQLSNFDFALISFSILLITAAGYIINDIYDIQIDKINKPEKVIIEKLINIKSAKFIYFIFNFLAILIGFSLQFNLGVFYIFSIFILWFYSYKLKKIALFGNIIVSIYTFLPILILNYYFQNKNFLIDFYCIFAFFLSLLREIVKDLEDIEGDKAINCKTLPIIIGVNATKKILVIISILFTGSYFLVVFLIGYFPYYFPLAFIFFLLVYFQIKLFTATNKAEFGFLSKFLKLIMLFGVLSIIFV